MNPLPLASMAPGHCLNRARRAERPRRQGIVPVVRGSAPGMPCLALTSMSFPGFLFPASGDSSGRCGRRISALRASRNGAPRLECGSTGSTCSRSPTHALRWRPSPSLSACLCDWAQTTRGGAHGFGSAGSSPSMRRLHVSGQSGMGYSMGYTHRHGSIRCDRCHHHLRAAAIGRPLQVSIKLLIACTGMELARALMVLLWSMDWMSEPCLRSASPHRGPERPCSSCGHGSAASSSPTSDRKRSSVEARRRRDRAGALGIVAWFTPSRSRAGQARHPEAWPEFDTFVRDPMATFVNHQST